MCEVIKTKGRREVANNTHGEIALQGRSPTLTSCLMVASMKSADIGNRK